MNPQDELRAFRKARGFSRADMAELIGVSVRTIEEYERPLGYPPPLLLLLYIRSQNECVRLSEEVGRLQDYIAKHALEVFAKGSQRRPS